MFFWINSNAFCPQPIVSRLCFATKRVRNAMRFSIPILWENAADLWCLNARPLIRNFAFRALPAAYMDACTLYICGIKCYAHRFLQPHAGTFIRFNLLDENGPCKLISANCVCEYFIYCVTISKITKTKILCKIAFSEPQTQLKNTYED